MNETEVQILRPYTLVPSLCSALTVGILCRVYKKTLDYVNEFARFNDPETIYSVRVSVVLGFVLLCS